MMTQTAQIQKYKGRLLIKYGGQRLLYCRGKLLLDHDGAQTEYDLGKYCGGIKKAGLKFRLTDRLLRLEPRCACRVDGGFLVSWQGKVLYLREDGTLLEEHTYRRGMNNPLSFTTIRDIAGFEDGVLYGEYTGNTGRKPVAIWHRSTAGVWKMIYEFPADTILHIHGIVPDGKNGRVLILTGDSDEESCIWESNDNFRTVTKLLGGSQKYRSCVAFPDGEDILYATDTPLEPNSVYRLKKGEAEPVEVMQLQGSCIYGASFTDKTGERQYAFITAVEPDASKKGWRYRLTYRLGKGISDRYTYINLLTASGDKRVLLRAKKDVMPLWLFQFGNFRVAETDKGFAVTGQALRHYDERTVEFDI